MLIALIGVGVLIVLVIPLVWEIDQQRRNLPRHYEFSYHTLRALVGVIALVIPILVDRVAEVNIDSVSASYHTQSQDFFVGLLFVVAAFLIAYEGGGQKRTEPGPNGTEVGHLERNLFEFSLAKLAGLSVAFVALFPTADCPHPDETPPDVSAPFQEVCAIPAYLGMDPSASGIVHLTFAFIFFGSLILIMAIFANRARQKPEPNGKKRAIFYGLCAAGMVAGVVYAIFGNSENSVYWGEFVMLLFFGLGWFWAGVYKFFEKEKEQPGAQ